VLGIGVCAGIGLCVLASWVVNLLYGADYAPGADVLRVIAWIGILSNVGSARNIWIQAEGKQSAVKYISLVTAITSIVLSIVLIPLYGLKGAAFACVAGFVVSSFGATWALKSTRPFVRLYFESFRTLWQAGKNYLQKWKGRRDA
jgi:O-antigen/teichoic acid export membrane protein